jgi:hypothetical protein
LDHILPRSYLAGFTSPLKQGQLSAFDLRLRCWFEASPASVGAEKGFYDYSPGSLPDQTADEAFSALESKFPVVRKELIESNFTAWATHREFLLEYAQMLRARSRLFRAQATDLARQSIIGVVDEVLEKGLKVKPYTPAEEVRHAQGLRNLTITQMRSEIAKGSGLFSKLHWCLRMTRDVNHPAITADLPVIVLGSAPETPVLQEAVLLDPNSWVVFPVCREAYLIGNALPLETETEDFLPLGLAWLQEWYFKDKVGFVYSPLRVLHVS